MVAMLVALKNGIATNNFSVDPESVRSICQEKDATTQPTLSRTLRRLKTRPFFRGKWKRRVKLRSYPLKAKKSLAGSSKSSRLLVHEAVHSRQAGTLQEGTPDLKKEVTGVGGTTINRIGIRTRADAIATMWVEELRSSLEHKFKLPKDLIETTAAEMKQLHVLSRPSNLKTSYLKAVNTTLRKFEDKFILPIKQSAA